MKPRPQRHGPTGRRTQRHSPPGHLTVTDDREADAVAIDVFPGTPRARTDVAEPGVLLHYDAAGRLIELEILGASTSGFPFTPAAAP